MVKGIIDLGPSEYSVVSNNPAKGNQNDWDVSLMPPIEKSNLRTAHILGLSFIDERARKKREELIQWFEKNRNEPWISFIDQALYMCSFGELYVKDISWKKIWIDSIQVKDWRNVSLGRYIDEDHIARIESM